METLRAELQLDVSAFTSALQQATARVQQFASTVTSQMAQATASLSTNTTATQANAAANNALLVALQNLQGTARQQLGALQQLTTLTQEYMSATRQAHSATSAWTQALSIAGGLGITTTLSGIASGLKTIAVEAVQVAVKMESLTAAFRGITGSSTGARADLEFLRRVATSTGTDFMTLARSFRNFEAASRGTALEGRKAQEVFEAISGASRVLGLSSAETGRALLALEQMVSKGKVSMEELRRQLGQAIPGAMQIAARAMGVTTAELEKMVKAGQESSEFVYAFGQQVRREFGPGLKEAAQTAQATFARLGNETQALGVSVGNAILAFLKPIADIAASTLRKIREERERLERGIPKGAATLEGLPASPALAAQSKEVEVLRQDLEGFLITASKFKVVPENLQKEIDATKAALSTLLVEHDKATERLKRGITFEAGAPGAIGPSPADKLADEVAKIQETATKADEALKQSLSLRQIPALEALAARASAYATALESAVAAAQKMSPELGAWPKETQQIIKEMTGVALALEAQRTTIVTAAEADKTARQEALQLSREQAQAEKQNAAQALANLREKEELAAAVAAQDQADAEHMHDAVDAIAKRIEAQQAAARLTITQFAAGPDTFSRQREKIMQDDAKWRAQFQDNEEAMVEVHQATTNRLLRLDDVWRKEQEDTLHHAQRSWAQLGDQIQDTLASAFENVLSGTFNLWDSIKQGFLKLLAELAAAALTQAVIIPIAMSVLGGTGGGGGGLIGAGGSVGMGGGVEGTTGLTGASSGSSSLGGALGMAQSGASLYQGFTGKSLLGSNGILSGVMQTSIGSVLGFGGSTSASAFFGGGGGVAGAYGMGEAGMVGAATPVAGSSSSLGTLGATSLGSLAAAAGVGIAAGQIFSKLNAMMGLHGTGNAVLAGAGGGAIAGTMILPGIGTAIGAAVGALGGYIASLFGNKKKPQPLYDPTAVQSGEVAYDATQGLHLVTQMAITRDLHRDVGGLAGWQKTVALINASLGEMATQVVSQFQGIAPELQQGLVAPLNAAFVEIATKIAHLSITGKTVEEFTTNLQEMMGTTLPGYFNDAVSGIMTKLQASVKKVEPVFNAFTQVIQTLQADIDALHDQQLEMHNVLQGARTALRTTLQSPAEAFMTAQGQYGAAKAAFGSGNAQQQILLAPALAQAAQQLLSMSKSEEVLGQDPALVKALQTSLLQDLDMLEARTDVAFTSMTTVLQAQVDAANAQKQALISGLSNPASLDQVIAGSLDALASIQNAIAASQGEGDPLVQAQVALLGGLNQIGTAQLQILQDISSKLGGGVGSFAEGSAYIPYSQMAYVHRGERIVQAGDTYGGATINLSVNVQGEATTQGASQIADAVIREIERRSSRLSTTTIVTKR